MAISSDINAYIAYNIKYYIMAEASVGVKFRILAILKKKPMSLSELSRQMKMRREFITGYLEAMRGEDEVEVVTVGRSKVYRPKR